MPAKTLPKHLGTTVLVLAREIVHCCRRQIGDGGWDLKGGLLWFGATGVVVARDAWKGKVLDKELIRSRGLGSSDSVLAESGHVFAISKAIWVAFSPNPMSWLEVSPILGWHCGFSSDG